MLSFVLNPSVVDKNSKTTFMKETTLNCMCLTKQLLSVFKPLNEWGIRLKNKFLSLSRYAGFADSTV